MSVRLLIISLLPKHVGHSSFSTIQPEAAASTTHLPKMVGNEPRCYQFGQLLLQVVMVASVQVIIQLIHQWHAGRKVEYCYFSVG
jgi:hypothetical protein